MSILKKIIIKESKGKSNNIAGLFNFVREINASYQKSLSETFDKYQKVHKKLEQLEIELSKDYKLSKLDYDFQLINDEDNNNFKEIQLEIDFVFENDNIDENKIDKLCQTLFGKFFTNGVLSKNKYNLYLVIK
jgi:uncharacterized protein YaaN involved in tellurite resistance